jgi:hypothetical protein
MTEYSEEPQEISMTEFISENFNTVFMYLLENIQNDSDGLYFSNVKNITDAKTLSNKGWFMDN